MARETACLSRADRATADTELATRPGGLGGLGDAAIAAEARRIAYRLDPHAVTDRARRAESGRRVTIRPAPDTMALVTGVLPAVQGVAVYAALVRHADSLRSSGDERSRNQIMADALVERVTGQAAATAVPAEVQVVMTDGTLLRGDQDAAHLDGYGPLPAPLTRDWIRDTADVGAGVWLRRLYVRPESGQLVAMDNARRCFSGQLRRFVVIRDQRCRTPWCDAPIRHVDHALAAASGGPTSDANAQGLCEACNYVKETVGWRAVPVSDGGVETTTPTGHRYPSRAPNPPGSPSGGAPPAHKSQLEIGFHRFILAA